MRFAGFFGVFGANEVWTFHIPSDDGSAVDIQGTRVLNNDGIHGFGGPSTTVEFTNPGLYALDVLFFESQASQWGIEFRGGLDGAVPTTDISSRLYSLRGFAEPGDDRLDSIQPGTPMPEPGTLVLLASAGLFALVGRRPRSSGAGHAALAGANRVRIMISSSARLSPETAVLPAATPLP